MQITMHRCNAVRLASTFVSNGNSVCLEVENRDGQTMEITLYDLPHEITAKFAVFRDGATKDYQDVMAA
ncbi:MAG TPA: hypothetical protein VGJ20_20340 [Xanthobacteraceae bacterium]